MRGLTPVPDLPYGELFHMHGQIMQPQRMLTPDILTTDILDL